MLIAERIYEPIELIEPETKADMIIVSVLNGGNIIKADSHLVNRVPRSDNRAAAFA